MGVGFNIHTFLPNPNQVHGVYSSDDFGRDTIYNGFMSYGSSTGVTNLGYYDWEHPPIEFFPNLLAINYKSSGLIAETTYTNDSSFAQYFGFTTNQEMQFFYYLYTTSIPAGLTPDTPGAPISTGVANIAKAGFDFNVYPNPMEGRGTVAYTLSAPASVNASITDITGKEVAVIKDENEQSGNYNVDITKSLPAGMYFATLTVNGETHTKKFVVE